MNYQIQISGIHCSGCVGLIQMTLDEQGFENIHVSQESNLASFTSNKIVDEIKKILDEIFAKDLNHYSYSNLVKIN